MIWDFQRAGRPSVGVWRIRRIIPQTPFPREISGSSTRYHDGCTACQQTTVWHRIFWRSLTVREIARTLGRGDRGRDERRGRCGQSIREIHLCLLWVLELTSQPQTTSFHESHLFLLGLKDYLGLIRGGIEPLPRSILNLQQCLSNFKRHSQCSREVLGCK